MKIDYSVNNSSQLAPILRQNHPVTNITLYFLLTYLLACLLTYSLHGAESFLRS